MKQLEWNLSKQFHFIYMPTGLREVVGRAIVDREMVLELLVLPNRSIERKLEMFSASFRF